MTAVRIGMCAVVILTRVGAATFTVNSTADLPDASTGDGACATGNLTPGGDAECTLRAAIQESNALPGFPPEQVKLPAGTYLLTAGTLEITSSLSIKGSGSDSTIVDGNGGRKSQHTYFSNFQSWNEPHRKYF